jgi:uncharacterized protein (DUF1330 family)
MPIRTFTRRTTISRTLLRSGLLTVAIAAGAACASSNDDDPPASPTPATTIDRLVAAYPDAALDPSREAWQALIDDRGYATEPISVVEFVRLKGDDEARTSYDAFVNALGPAVTSVGGNVVSVNDILMPGLEGLEGYDGGVSWIATFPTISAYVDTMLDAGVVAAAEQRRAAVAEAQVLAGKDLIPENIKQLPPNEPASAFPSDRVQGKTPQQIVDEVLAAYPSGGADPTRATLEAMTRFEGWEAQRVHFINLYRFNDDPGGGATALGEYNAGALPYVLAHGGRPKVLANVSHHLVGPTAWDRFIFVAWPSLAVFTDLRLEPGYIEAQKDRVMSAEQYGNLITIARADQAQPPAE